ncbi:GGDEF domain-containing protein [Paenibacillus sp. NFR01]|uniref:GGDEF domain-containing protein n=1 Tax=Paenibacillus sp. NFR01 TaxID=1566279 RepID=UPI00111374A4|nr:GGDEF domain-containing protein [Paenibacillus sp. NFR01]
MLAYRSRYKDEASRLSVASKLLQILILGLLLVLAPGHIRYILPIFIMLYLAAAVTEAFSLLKLLGAYSERVKERYFTLVAIAGSGLIILYPLLPSRPYFVAVASLTGAFGGFYPAYVLLVKLKETPLQKLIGVLYIVVILSLLGKGILAVGHLAERAPAVGGFLQDLFYVGLYLQMLIGTAGFMLLMRERSYAELERAATYDELTGILNRRAFVQRARPLIMGAARHAVPYSFLLVDVDHFKSVNDSHGHDTGDRVLRHFAGKIAAELDRGDLFGRFGGEEFAILLHRADETAAEEIAERLRRVVEASALPGMSLSYTISLGLVTVQPGQRVPLNTLYRLSDKALYEAKQQGRNCVVHCPLV